MGAAYSTVDEYRTDTGDEASSDARVGAMLAQQSAYLRALVGITEGATLSDDAQALARALVNDSVRKALAPKMVEGFGDTAGATSASWGANGFSASATFANPSGSAYFDRTMLAAFKRAAKVASVRMVYPYRQV